MFYFNLQNMHVEKEHNRVGKMVKEKEDFLQQIRTKVSHLKKKKMFDNIFLPNFDFPIFDSLIF